MATQPFLRQLGVLVVIALVMTAGVYGLVGGIVKLDDLGLRLNRAGGVQNHRRHTLFAGRDETVEKLRQI